MHTLHAMLLASLTTFSTSAALAQDEGEESLDDILGTDEDEDSSVREEREAIEEEADAPASARTDVIVLPEREDRTIKALPTKTFLKMRRFEAMPFIGYVPNEPFIHRILFGLGIGYHITDIFQIELQGSYAPDFGQGDWKPVTTAIFDNDVAPKISRQVAHFLTNFNYSPFYGKIAGRNSTINFDIYGTFGVGFVYTEDDIEVIHGERPPPEALATANQIHPALSAGAGIRVAFNQTFALRFEGRTISYIGVLDSAELEIKNNLALLLGASIFFGRRFE